VDVYRSGTAGRGGGVTPFNFPAMVPMWMFANALVCGNTFVLKPSEKDPSVSLPAADLLRQPGCPTAWFNVLQGDRVAVDRCWPIRTYSPSFVGSTPVAKAVIEAGTRAGKRVQALGGGRTTWSCCPMPTSARPPTPRLRRLRLGRGSAAWQWRCGRRRLGGRHPGRGDRGSGRQLRVGPGRRPGFGDGAADQPRDRDKWRPFWVPPAPMSWWMSRLTEQPGFFLGPSLVDNVIIDSPLYTDRSSAGAVGVRVDTLRRGVCAWSTTTRTAMARRCSPGRRRGAAFPVRRGRGMVGINVRSRCRWPLQFGGWKASLFGDLNMYGPEGIQSTPAARWSRPLPDPGHQRLTSASRR